MEHLPWHVVETPYRPRDNIYRETILTLGNGYVAFRGRLVGVRITGEGTDLTLKSGAPLAVLLNGRRVGLE